MDFALDEVLLRAFRRFWPCGPFGVKTTTTTTTKKTKQQNNGNSTCDWGS